MRRAARRFPLAFAAAIVALGGCADTDDPVGPDDLADVELEVSGFPSFAQAEGHFELWISFAEVGTRPGARHANAVSAGKFKVNEEFRIVGLDYQPTAFSVDPTDARADVDGDGVVDWRLAVDALITLESTGDADDEPNVSALASGNFVDGRAALRVSGAEAIGVDLTGAGGTYVMETPTTTAATDSSTSPSDPRLDLAGGIWFTPPGGASGSLTLPALSADSGWWYEGWLSLGFAGSVSLGRFRDPLTADADGPGPMGPIDGPGYAFPGSDFPLGEYGQTFAGGNVLVTIEPDGNQDGSGPFVVLTVLSSAPIAPDATEGTTSTLFSSSAPLPTATVTIPFDPGR